MGKKKITCIVLVILVAGVLAWNWDDVSSLLNSGLYQNGKAGLVTEDNLEGRNNEQKKPGGTATHGKSGKSDFDETGVNDKRNSESKRISKVKKQRFQTRDCVLAEDKDYSVYDNTLYAWWFKRNDNHEQSGCQEDFDITQYDAHYTVPVSEKKMYITFDCGYENGFTPDMLDVLKEEQVTAAFFVTQTFIRDNVDLVKRMKEEGHLVCNHTVTHPSMPGKSVEEQRKELLDCENYMKQATGYELDLFYRPPKGEYSQRSLQVAKDLGYTTVFWSIAYLDYDVNNQPSREHVVEHFKKYYHPGAIPLLHNVSQANHDALQQVLQDLKKEGYTFGSLYDLWVEPEK